MARACTEGMFFSQTPVGMKVVGAARQCGRPRAQRRSGQAARQRGRESENTMSSEIPFCQTPVGLSARSVFRWASHRQRRVGCPQPQEKAPRPAGVRHFYKWSLRFASQGRRQRRQGEAGQPVETPARRPGKNFASSRRGTRRKPSGGSSRGGRCKAWSVQRTAGRRISDDIFSVIYIV